MLTNVKYLDALAFVLDLPWNKRVLEDGSIQENGEWSLTSKPLKPGTYNLYVEFWDEDNSPVARSDHFRIKVPRGVGESELEALTSPSEAPIELQTSTPTLSGSDAPGVRAVLFDDFSRNPWRIAVNLWRSDGVFLTLRVTFIAFSSALIIGLIFGLMRVSNRSPDLRVNAWMRLLIGVGIIILVLVAAPQLRTTASIVLVVLVVEA